MLLSPEIQLDIAEEKIEDIEFQDNPEFEQPEILQPDEYESGGSQDSLQAVVDKYGDGNWEKTWDSSQDIEAKYNRAGDYMEQVGPERGQNLTEQIKGGKHEAQHLEILDGWKNNPTETQFVEHREIVDGQEILHVTAITLGPDDTIHSETWTRKLEEHEKNFDDGESEDDLFGENFEADEESEDDFWGDEQKNSQEASTFAFAENKEGQGESDSENLGNGVELFQNQPSEETEAIEIQSGITIETTEENSEQKLAIENDLQLEIQAKPFNNPEINKRETLPAQNLETEISKNEANPGITLEIAKPAKEQLVKNENSKIEIEANESSQIFQPETNTPLEEKPEITKEPTEKNNAKTETLEEKPEIAVDLTAEAGIDLIETPTNIQSPEEKPAQVIEIKAMEFPGKETVLLETENEQASHKSFDYSFNSGITLQAEKILNISQEKENKIIKKSEEKELVQKEAPENFNQEISIEADTTIVDFEPKQETGKETEEEIIEIKVEKNLKKETVESEEIKDKKEILAPENAKENKENLILNDAGIALEKKIASPKTEAQKEKAEIKITPESNYAEIKESQRKVINLFDRLSVSPRKNLGDEEDIIDIAEEEKISLNNFGINLIKQAA